MDIQVSTQEVRQFQGDAIAVGVFTSGSELSGPTTTLDEITGGALSQLRESGEISGTAGEVTILHSLGKFQPDRIAVIGLGAREGNSAARIRRGAAIACRALRKAGAKRIGLALGVDSGVDAAQMVRAATEGAILGLYSFTQ